jgi:hypothetical protein
MQLNHHTLLRPTTTCHPFQRTAEAGGRACLLLTVKSKREASFLEKICLPKTKQKIVLAQSKTPSIHKTFTKKVTLVKILRNFKIVLPILNLQQKIRASKNKKPIF